jgi:putative lipoic acid-binding regulatory protein
MSDEKSLLQFPCAFPVKVMGHNSEEFFMLVRSVFAKHLPSLDEVTITRRLSSGDKYLSLTVTFQAQSKEQLNEIYEDLNGHEEILMTL